MVNDHKRMGLEISVAFGYSPIVSTARNHIIQYGEPMRRDSKPFGGKEYDYMMWIDSDMDFEPENVRQLIDCDVDIVSGLAVIDSSTVALNAGFLDEKTGEANFIYAPALSQHPVNEKGLIEVDFVGFAFVLIKRGVFETMGAPWFRIPEREVDGVIIPMGEDIDWCMRARKHGFKIHAHPGVHIGHEKNVVLRF